MAIKNFLPWNWFQKAKTAELKPVKTAPIGLKHRLGKSKGHDYIAEMAIVFEGKPIRQFQANVKASSRDNAAHKMNKGMSVKLLSVHQVKATRKSNRERQRESNNKSGDWQ